MNTEISSSISPEGYQLVECVRAYIAGAQAELKIDPACAEACAGLFSLAFRHKLLPVVFDTLSHCEKLVSSPAAASLRDTAKKQAVMQAYLADEFMTFLRLLGEAGFKPVVLKGELCRRLYPKPELRLSSDEDIYIDPAHAEACVSAMLDMGFTVKTPSADGSLFDGSGVAALDGSDGLHIELHKRLIGVRRGFSLEKHFERAFERSVVNTAEGGPINMFAPTDALFYLIAHAAKHFEGGGFGLRTAADISAFAMRFYDKLDAASLRSLLESSGLSGFAAGVFSAAEKHLGYDAEAFPIPGLTDPAVDCEPMLADCIEGGVYGTATAERAQSAKYTKAEARGGSRLGVFIKSVFPPRSELLDRYPFVGRSPLLVPAAWAARITKYVFSGRKDAQSGAALGSRRAKLLALYGLSGREGGR